MPTRISLPLAFSAPLARAASTVSRLTGRGGAVIGGHVLTALTPDAIEQLSVGKEIILVTGTNGKTTTSLFLASALRTKFKVAANDTGANLPSGISYMLLNSGNSSHVVIETDEGRFADILKRTGAQTVVLLNLSRDQLDRYGDVRIIARRLRDAISATPGPKVIANASDPLVVWVAGDTTNITWVDPGARGWNRDHLLCPVCNALLIWDVAGRWSCVCGFEQPQARVVASADAISIDGESFPVKLRTPGSFNVANAAIAIAAAKDYSVDPRAGLDAVSSIDDVQGRYRSVRVGSTTLRLMLAKNPAGWHELLSLGETDKNPVVLIVNSQTADGHDVSWLWDVDFELLAGRDVIACGERATETTARLRYGDVSCDVFYGSAVEAAKRWPNQEVDVIANYTAFRDLLVELK